MYTCRRNTRFQSNKRFPVLYLRHGGGDNEASWSQESGRAPVIIDNLMGAAQGHADDHRNAQWVDRWQLGRWQL